jgi:hypothetical protein
MSILKAGAEAWYEQTELRVINEGTGWINVAINQSGSGKSQVVE